jgi:flagellin
MWWHFDVRFRTSWCPELKLMPVISKMQRSPKLVSLISDAAMVSFQTLNARSGVVESARLRGSNDVRFAVSDDETTKTTLDSVESALGEDAGLRARRTILSGADTALQAGVAAAKGVRDTVVELKAIAIQAEAENIETETRDDLIERFETLRNRLAGQVDQATVNGVNVIEEYAPDFKIKDTEGNDIKIESQDLSAQGLGISHVKVTLTSQATESAALLKTTLTTLDSRIETLEAKADEIGAAHDTAKTATGYMPNGVAELIDPDITLQSAELRAIDIRQRLGETALAIANVDGFALIGLVRSDAGSIKQSAQSGSDSSNQESES